METALSYAIENPENLAFIDGKYYDPETGEEISFENGSVERKPWQIADVSSLEWALGKMREAKAKIAVYTSAKDAKEADLLAQIEALPEVQAIRLQIEALNGQAEKVCKPCERTLAFFEPIVLNEGAEIARKELEGKKERTYHCLNGSISFRKSVGSVKIKDMDAAVEVAFQNGLDEKVKQTVNASDLKKIVIDLATKDPENDQLSAFDIELPADKVSIDLGV